MNLLVTGATGFIGSHLCRELVRKGHEVFALSRSGGTRNVESLLRLKEFHLVKGDIQDADMMQALIKNNRIKAVFHLAAQLPDESGTDSPFSSFDTNTRGTLNVLNAAALNNVERFIYASTMSVYSEPPQYLPVDECHPVQPPTIYGVSKLTGELCCNPYSRSLNITVLRLSGAYGRGERELNATRTFITQALNNRPLTIFGDGTQTSDYVYVEDVVQGTLSAWENNKSGVYNIGSGEETSVRTLAERIVKITGSKSKITLTLKETDRPFRFYLDIKKSQKDLGYSPRSLDKGLRAYLKEFNVEE